jgi:heterotetrameric sarcosine oxidase delta subunit
MRIDCPFCGSRDAHEFAYRGDATLVRPDYAAGAVAMADHVYLRNNVAGPIEEHWYHAGGCRNWLVVTRDTRDHAITAVRMART